MKIYKYDAYHSKDKNQMIISTDAAIMDSHMEVPQKIKNRPIYDQVIPLQALLPKKTKTVCQINTSTPSPIGTLFTIAKITC
jgi:hypothetical protein